MQDPQPVLDEQAQQKLRYRQLEMRAEYQQHLLNVAKWDAWVRTTLAIILVVGLFVVVGVGVLNSVTAAQLSPLVAPLAGLTGIAVGYFFGQGAGPPSFEDQGPSRD
jgi:hypothetical protein